MLEWYLCELHFQQSCFTIYTPSGRRTHRNAPAAVLWVTSRRRGTLTFCIFTNARPENKDFQVILTLNSHQTRTQASVFKVNVMNQVAAWRPQWEPTDRFVIFVIPYKTVNYTFNNRQRAASGVPAQLWDLNVSGTLIFNTHTHTDRGSSRQKRDRDALGGREDMMARKLHRGEKRLKLLGGKWSPSERLNEAQTAQRVQDPRTADGQ